MTDMPERIWVQKFDRQELDGTWTMDILSAKHKPEPFWAVEYRRADLAPTAADAMLAAREGGEG